MGDEQLLAEEVAAIRGMGDSGRRTWQIHDAIIKRADAEKLRVDRLESLIREMADQHPEEDGWFGGLKFPSHEVKDLEERFSAWVNWGGKIRKQADTLAARRCLAELWSERCAEVPIPNPQGLGRPTLTNFFNHGDPIAKAVAMANEDPEPDQADEIPLAVGQVWDILPALCGFERAMIDHIDKDDMVWYYRTNLTIRQTVTQQGFRSMAVRCILREPGATTEPEKPEPPDDWWMNALKAQVDRLESLGADVVTPTPRQWLAIRGACGLDYDGPYVPVADALKPLLARHDAATQPPQPELKWDQIQENALGKAAKLLKGINLPVYVSAVEAILARGTPEEEA